MDHQPWLQINIAFPDWDHAETVALTHVAPLLAEAEAERTITAWFFLRKAPCWRVRYTYPRETVRDHAYLLHGLDQLRHCQHIHSATSAIYEPEVHAFGGQDAMTGAHAFFHADSRHVVNHLTHTGPVGGRRRELAVVFATTMLRAAGLDWYEQGDVWARVAAHRNPPPTALTATKAALADKVRHLMTGDALSPEYAPWAATYARAGQGLAGLATSASLHRGIRAVLAHHLIFAWNRLGLAHQAQAVLAHTAKTVVFGDDPR